MKITKKALLLFSPLILVLVALCIFFSPFLILRIAGIPEYIRNNHDLKIFANHLFDYPLPQGSQVKSSTSYVTLLGNSNHCDFVAEQVVVTELSQNELAEYYQNTTFPPVRSEPQSFEDSRAGGIHPPIKPHLEILETDEINGILVFRVIIVDTGYPAGFDYRCN